MDILSPRQYPADATSGHMEGAEVVIETHSGDLRVVARVPEPYARQAVADWPDEAAWRATVRRSAQRFVGRLCREGMGYIARAWLVMDPSRDREEEVELRVVA